MVDCFYMGWKYYKNTYGLWTLPLPWLFQLIKIWLFSSLMDDNMNTAERKNTICLWTYVILIEDNLRSQMWPPNQKGNSFFPFSSFCYWIFRSLFFYFTLLKALLFKYNLLASKSLFFLTFVMWLTAAQRGTNKVHKQHIHT